MQFLYVSHLINFTFNDFVPSITHSSFNQKVITHILDIVFITRSHIFLSKIHLKFVMEFGPHISYWSIVGWSVVGALGRWSVGRWLVVGGWVIGW